MREPTTKERQCLGKSKFSTRAQVNKSIRSMTRRKSFGGLEMSAYK